jgi:quercetin dioxygenase-like cupin family protein
MMQTDAGMTRHEPIVKEDRNMDTATFEASLKNAGYEIGTSKGTPSKVTQAHSHDFDVRALVLSGELTLTTDGTSRTYRVGDIFEMPAGCVHSEQYGPDGSEALVGRRPKPTRV